MRPQRLNWFSLSCYALGRASAKALRALTAVLLLTSLSPTQGTFATEGQTPAKPMPQSVTPQTATSPTLADARVEKLILVATTEGGGGHMTAANAVKAALESQDNAGQYHYKVVLVDVNNSARFSEMACQIWDRSFQSGWFEVLVVGTSLKDHLGKAYDRVARIPHADLGKFMCAYLKLEKHITDHLEQAGEASKPDMIISVVNSWNNELFVLAQKWGIPLRVIPTDYQNEIFLQGLHGSHSAHDLTIFLPFADTDVAAFPEKQQLPTEILGYPLKREFLAVANAYRDHDAALLAKIEALRQHYEVAANDRMVFAMMGAKGFDESALHLFLRAFYKNRSQFKNSSAEKLHVFVAAGKNDALRARVEGLAAEMDQLAVKDMVYHALPMLSGDEVALHMAASDVIFSKPGGATTSEILALNKAVVFLANPIAHEGFNADVMVKNGWGKKLKMGHRKKAFHLQTLGASLQGEQEPAAKLERSGDFRQAIESQASRPSVGKSIKALILNSDMIDEEAFVAAFRPYLVDGEQVASSPRNEFPKALQTAVTATFMHADAEQAAKAAFEADCIADEHL